MPRKHLVAHIKNAKDAAKAKIWQRTIREIYVAVKAGGPDPDTNPRLRLLIEKCKSQNMSKDTMQRNIDKAAGSNDAVDYKENTYEGYGPGGVAVIVETLTDNINRTVANVRSHFKKNGGELGKENSVAYAFERMGQLIIESKDVDADELMLMVSDVGAEDFIVEDDYIEVRTSPENFLSVKKAMDEMGIEEYIQADIKYVPTNPIALTEENEDKVMKLIEVLESDDDVQSVVTNME